MADKYKLALLLLTTLLLAGLFIGLGLTADNYGYFLSRRAPKVIAIVLAGVSIGVASLLFQTITNNRILTPSIMGFDSLYLLVQVLMVAVFGGFSQVFLHTYANFAISTAVMVGFSVLLFGFYFRFAKGQDGIFTLLLLGVVFSALFSSVTSFISMVLDPNEFAMAQGAMFSSFNNVNADLVYFCIVPLLALLALIYRYGPQLDVLWLGEATATSLGIDCARLHKLMLILIAVLIAMATALVGPILFFGLIVVSLTRQLFSGYQHQRLMLATGLLASCMLLAGQWTVEHLINFQTTLSVIINFVGGCYFLYLLARQKIS